MQQNPKKYEHSLITILKFRNKTIERRPFKVEQILLVMYHFG